MASRSVSKAPSPGILPAPIKRGIRSFFGRLMGVALMVLGGLALIALATFAPTDATLNQTSGASLQNWLGAWGANFADLGLQSVGIVSAFLFFPLCTHGLRMAWGLGPGPWRRNAFLIVIGGLFLVTGLAALPAPSGWPFAVGLGGLLGDLITPAFSYINSMASDLTGERLPTQPFAWAAVGIGALIWLLGLSIGIRAMLFSGFVAARGTAKAGSALAQGAGTMGTKIGGLMRRQAEVADDNVAQAADIMPKTKPKKKRPPLAVDNGPKSPIRIDMPKTTSTREKPTQRSLDLGDGYRLPDVDLLERPPVQTRDPSLSADALQQNARLLETVLADFGIKGEIVGVKPGPVVTLYELEPAAGIKASRVIGLADDIARSMSAVSARIAVVPGRTVIGIELPNMMREMVSFREMVGSSVFQNSKTALPMILGKNIGGGAVVTDLAPMPHLLIAGTTGSGKSVGLNAMILSLLFKLSPAQCRLIMIDPKMLELSVYDDIPHLLAPVVTDPRKAVVALKWVVREMEERYAKMAQIGVRNLEAFNQKVRAAGGEPLQRETQAYDKETGEVITDIEELNFEELPLIVVVVDELADLMVVAGKDVEGAIQRLAQMARAAGIHLIMATQRPSVDVITGVIKANLPTRISFQVTSKIDSRTILENMGAEQLLGKGDMLFMEKGKKITRVHAPFVSDDEVEKVVAHLKKQGRPDYDDGVTTESEDGGGILDVGGAGGGEGSGNELYDRAVHVVLTDRKVSTSYIQRKLQIGYNRAANLIERMEAEGVISPANHAGKREILVDDHL